MSTTEPWHESSRGFETPQGAGRRRGALGLEDAQGDLAAPARDRDRAGLLEEDERRKDASTLPPRLAGHLGRQGVDRGLRPEQLFQPALKARVSASISAPVIAEAV